MAFWKRRKVRPGAPTEGEIKGVLEGAAEKPEMQRKPIKLPEHEPAHETHRPARHAGTHEAELERLRMQMEALSRMRSSSNERLLKLSDKVGELRGMVTDRDGEVKELSERMEELSDAVKAAHLDDFLPGVRKAESKLESLTEKLAELEKRFGKLHDTEELARLSDEVKKNLGKTEETLSDARKHADRTRDNFIKVERGLKEFRELKNLVKRLDRKFADTRQGFKSLEDKFHRMATKEDLREMEKEVGRKAAFIEDSVKGFEEYEQLLKDLLERRDELMTSMQREEGKLEKIDQELSRSLKPVENISKKHGQELRRLSEETGELAKKVDNLYDIWLSMQRKVKRK